MDFLIDRRKDKELMKAIHLVHDWKRLGLSSKFVLNRGVDSADLAREALNYYEFVALSILQGALDEGMYKQMQYSNFLKFWTHAEPLVREIRKAAGKDTFFQDMEWLARRWKSYPLEQNSTRYLR